MYIYIYIYIKKTIEIEIEIEIIQDFAGVAARDQGRVQPGARR